MAKSPFDPEYQNIVSRIRYYARQYNLDENISIWQIWQESKFNPRASSGEADGIAQFTPATAKRFGVNVWDIESSLNGWGKYMSWLLRQSYINGNIQFALAGYNAGEGRVLQYKGIPPFKETQNYVLEIMRNAGKAIPVPGAIAQTNSFDSSPSPSFNFGAAGFMLAAILILFLITE